MSQERPAVIGQHCYQPPRSAVHPDLVNLVTDLSGVDWTDRITAECYLPQLELGILEHTAFDMYGVLRAQLDLDQRQLEQIETAMAERGVGDTFLHPILPDLTRTDRLLLLEAGRVDFYNQAGRWPAWLWPPETALDTASLIDARNCGYSGVICAPEQLQRQDGLPADSSPVRVSLGSEGYILALPFDRPISSELGFSSKKNADDFTKNVILPRLAALPPENPIVAWTDGETFGHHDPHGHLFLEYLVKTSLPNHNIHPVSIIEALKHLELSELPLARLQERTAWSCPHGDLKRWNGECDCGFSGDKSWKAPFMAALRAANQQVTAIVNSELPDWQEQLSSHFRHYCSSEFLKKDATPADYLLLAKASSLAALTSCATFFKDVNVSGRLNVLFVLQAGQALVSAGLKKQGQQLQAEFYHHLGRIHDASRGASFALIIDELMKQLR